MIVDAHTHVWDSPDQLGPASAKRLRETPCDPWDRPDASATAYDRAMQTVDHAFVLGLVSTHLGATISSEQVARQVARMPWKYLGFAGVDPMADGFLDAVDHAIALSLVGVTISPAGQNFTPTHDRAMALLERCQQRRLPVIVQSDTHLGAAARLEFAQPFHWDTVAQAFPTLRVVLAQAGHPWLDQTLVLLAKHPHLYADLSDVTPRPWQLYQTLVAAHERGVLSKLVLGSDFPFSTPDAAARNIYLAHTMPRGSSLPMVPRQALRDLIERDVLACLGITPPAGSEAEGDVTDRRGVSGSEPMNKVGTLQRWLLAGCVLLAGCGGLARAPHSGGKLSIRSQSRGGPTLKGGFDTGMYSFDDQNNVTIVLFDGPPENPAQAVTIRLFWTPRAGKTPIDPTATNATIHYVIFTPAGNADHPEAGQAGVYSGAGFLYPEDYPGGKRLKGSVWEANLNLRDSSHGFTDLLGQARLKGEFSARRDDAGVPAAIRRLNVMVRDRLGYPRLVDGPAMESKSTMHD